MHTLFTTDMFLLFKINHSFINEWQEFKKYNFVAGGDDDDDDDDNNNQEQEQQQ